MSVVHPLAPAEVAKLDPGIRRTVVWLRGLGFQTTDSGDGASKGEDGLDFPHVFIKPNAWSDLIQTARLLLWHLQGHAKIEVSAVGRGAVFIEASFDPFDGSAIVQLHGLDDAALVAAGVLSEERGDTPVEDKPEHWERLAVDSEQLAAWNREHGIDLSRPGSSAGDHRAATYRATAKALRLEAATGRPHCSTCFGAHPNHQHGHRG